MMKRQILSFLFLVWAVGTALLLLSVLRTGNLTKYEFQDKIEPVPGRNGIRANNIGLSSEEKFTHSAAPTREGEEHRGRDLSRRTDFKKDLDTIYTPIKDFDTIYTPSAPLRESITLRSGGEKLIPPTKSATTPPAARDRKGIKHAHDKLNPKRVRWEQRLTAASAKKMADNKSSYMDLLPNRNASQKYLFQRERIWPALEETDDRIPAQMYTDHSDAPGEKLKTIFVQGGLSRDHSPGRGLFLSHQCPVNRCSLTDSKQMAPMADAVVFKNSYSARTQGSARPPHQIWVLYILESPYHGYVGSSVHNPINWTATYRTDSTLVTPYERFTYFANFTGLPAKPDRNYAKGKTKKVAWFVSNCHTVNGRFDYVTELRKHIAVDIYGGCGTLSCPRHSAANCSGMLKTDYKFYLAFENSNCKDYITEKLYWNALYNDIVPIVMGARREDYDRAAPLGSFIHVDDFPSPAALAAYLHRLDADDALYNSYFRWKGTGEFINTKFWCRLCRMIHEAAETRRHWSYERLEEWWKGPGVCLEPGKRGKWSSWRGVNDTFDYALSYPKTWINPL